MKPIQENKKDDSYYRLCYKNPNGDAYLQHIYIMHPYPSTV